MGQDPTIIWMKEAINSIQDKECFSQLKTYSTSLLEAEALESIKDLLARYNETSPDSIDRYARAKIQASASEAEAYQLILSQDLQEKRTLLFKLALIKSLETALQGCYKEQFSRHVHENEFLFSEAKEIGSEHSPIQYSDIEEAIQSVQKKGFFSQLEDYSNSLRKEESLESITTVLSSYSEISELSIDRYIRAKIKASPNESEAYQLILSQDLQEKKTSLFKLVFIKSLEAALTGCYKEQSLNSISEYEFLSSVIKEVRRGCNSIEYFNVVAFLHKVRLGLAFKKLPEAMQKQLEEEFPEASIYLKAMNNGLSASLELDQSMQEVRLAWSALIQEIQADKALLQKISDAQEDIRTYILCFCFASAQLKNNAMILWELHAQFNRFGEPLQRISEHEFFASFIKEIRRKCNHIQYFDIVSFLHEVCLNIIFERLHKDTQTELKEEFKNKPVSLKAIDAKLVLHPRLNQLIQSDKLAWIELIQAITADQELLETILKTPVNIAEAVLYLAFKNRKENHAETLRKLYVDLARFIEPPPEVSAMDMIAAYAEDSSHELAESPDSTDNEDALISGYLASPELS